MQPPEMTDSTAIEPCKHNHSNRSLILGLRPACSLYLCMQRDTK